MILTGIPKLDEFLNGIPEGKSLLFHVEPGVEESNIGIHVLHKNLENGLYGIYVVSESSPKIVDKVFNEFNWNLDKYDNLIIVDGYSSLIGAPTDKKYVVEEPHDIESYEDVLMEIIENIKGKGIIVFDSLSNIMDMCGEKKTLSGIERINDILSGEGFSSIYNFIAWPYKESVMYRMKRIFNAIIEVNNIGDTIMRQRMFIKKVDWSDSEGKKLEFKIFKPEGIRIYIPKISVVGPFYSGKTTFIKSIAHKFTPVERLGATVGVEYGIVDYKGYRAEIFGIPGQERFLPLLNKIGVSSKGVFLVVDSTKPEEFDFAKKILGEFKNIPYIIVANKQDLPNALKGDEIKERMGLKDATVVETIATEGKGVYEAFELMANRIVEDLNAR
ncbi:MAG TPA: GTP-binding protein [Thermoplasmatales archaeon]|nr:GTP-binding protein [Thermoplasmatales archaeon]